MCACNASFEQQILNCDFCVAFHCAIQEKLFTDKGTIHLLRKVFLLYWTTQLFSCWFFLHIFRLKKKKNSEYFIRLFPSHLLAPQATHHLTVTPHHPTWVRVSQPSTRVQGQLRGRGSSSGVNWRRDVCLQLPHPPQLNKVNGSKELWVCTRGCI